MGYPTYVTVELLMAAANYKTTAAQLTALRRATAGASRRIEDTLHRRFYPTVKTRTYTDPMTLSPREASGSGIDLDDDLLSLTAVTRDGTALTPGDLELHPVKWGPPYWWLGVTGSEIAVTGIWGYSQDTAPAGALEAAIADTTTTTVDVTDSAAVGIGDLLKIDSERMIVEAKSLLDTGQNLAANLTADTADTTVATGSGAAFSVGETIYIDGERMLIVDIAGNNLSVRRAWDGTPLAAHTGTLDIYAPRRLTVERGALGTTAAAHTDTTAITRNLPPVQVTELALAEALTTLEQENAAYARVVGSGDNQREARGKGLDDLRRQILRYRRVRLGAI